MKYDFSDKVIVITGGTGALGRVLTKSFLSYNPRTIVVTYRSEKEMLELKTELGNLLEQPLNISTTIEFTKVDVTRDDETKRSVSNIVERHGQIHVLINVVGSYIGGKSVTQLDESEWDRMISINLKSAFLISKHVIPVMVTNNYGKLVHIASKTGLVSNGYDSAYAASKAGLIRFVESAYQEVKKSNININCILPTILDTEYNRKEMPNADYSKWIKLEDLSKVILFLSSDDSKIINGAAIPAYGLL
ncbi:MAG TPA: SDR family NAD(P)-dependent oxidoreductase [Phototrophicaceae bacterium]|nr:SDR family NAD(P)-dependent oxidoreductase [Phototrophicaceae bacterium]